MMNISKPNQSDQTSRVDESIETDLDDSDESTQIVYAERPNKEQGKRESKALKDLGLRLATLPKERLVQFGLSERTLDAIEEFNRIKDSARSGRKRQVQLIIKVLRDEDKAVILAAMDEEKNEQREQSLTAQRAADLRDELLSDDDALEAFLKERGLGNEFRTLVRQARREQAKNGKPNAQRAVYRQLQSMLDREQHKESE